MRYVNARTTPVAAAGLALFLLLVPPAARAGVEKAPGGIRFTYSAPYATTVSLAGEFNGWNATANPMNRDADGLWSTVVNLRPGQHEYKFVVDGQWVADPGNPVTLGDFGNSGIEIGPDGSLVAMKPTSNTELSPRILLESRYISLMQSRKNPLSNPEWDFERPDFDIDLDFHIQVNPSLRAHVLTNINNANQNVQLWETRLNFDRGSLHLDNEDIRLIAFDNDAIANWDDPLTLVGNVGIYDHAWGYDHQGITADRDLGPVHARILYSDDFRPGGTDGPDATAALIAEAAGEKVADGARSPGALAGDDLHVFDDTDANKDVFAARVTRDFRDGLRGGLSFRLDRGANPGELATVVRDSGSVTTRQLTVHRYETTDSWIAGGADLRYFSDPAGVELWGEFLFGELSADGIRGETVRFTATIDTASGSATAPGENQLTVTGGAPDRSFRLDTSRRFVLGGHYFAYRGWHWRGSLEFEDHDLRTGGGRLQSRYNRLATWNLGVSFSGKEWMDWPWEAGLAFTYYDFSYGDRTRWLDQFWFDSNNFWLEEGRHKVTVDRLVMLGGHDVVSWRPHAAWTFQKERNARVEYRGILNSNDVGNKPKYWENLLTFHVDLTRRLGLNTDSRIVAYDDPVLDLDETFLSHFVELKYFFTPTVEVALSWGVDPWVIDPPTNEYAYVGRDRFLFDLDGNTPAEFKGRFLDLGRTIRRAEQELEDEKRIQLEAILRF